MLTNMFYRTAPEEIVNIIDDPTASIAGGSDALLSQNFNASYLETFNHVSDQHFFNQKDPQSNNVLDTNNFGSDDGFL